MGFRTVPIYKKKDNMAGLGDSLGGVLGASLGGAVISGVFSGINQRKAQERQFEYEKQLMDKQYEMNEAMWNKQNEYNEDVYNRLQSPQAMVDQYKEAGLNPAALAGSSPTAAVGTSAPEVSGGSASAFPASVPDFGAAALSALEMKARIDNINADTKNLQSQTKERDVLLPGREEALRLQNGLTDVTIEGQSIANSMAETQKQILEATTQTQIDSAFEDLRMKREQRKQLEFKTSKQAEEYDLWLQNQMMDLCVKSASINLVDAQRQLTMEQLNTEVAKQEHLYKEAVKIAAETDSLNISNEEKRRTFDSRIEAVEAQNKDLKRTNSIAYRVWSEFKDALRIGASFMPGVKINNSTSSNPDSHGRYTTLYGADGKPAATNSW